MMCSFRRNIRRKWSAVWRIKKKYYRRPVCRSHLQAKHFAWNDTNLQLDVNPKRQCVWQRYGFVTGFVNQCVMV